MEMEIFSQPESLLKTLSYGARLAGGEGCPKLGGLEKFTEQIVGIENFVITACGSSKHAGIFA